MPLAVWGNGIRGMKNTAFEGGHRVPYEADIQDIMNNGLGSMLAVSSSGKITTTWGDLKQQ